MTLLQEFISGKVDKYREPVREGTARGEKIGFSKKKYEAAVYTGVTNLNARKLSDLLNTSYGLLRQWRMEKEFIRLANDSCKEFVNSLLTHMNSTQRSEPQQGRQLNNIDDELKDVVIFSSEIAKIINNKIDHCFTQSIDLLKDEIIIMLEVVRTISNEEYCRALKKYIQNAITFFENSTLVVKDTTSWGPPTKTFTDTDFIYELPKDRNIKDKPNDPDQRQKVALAFMFNKILEFFELQESK